MSKKIEIHCAVELSNNAVNRDRNGRLKRTTGADGEIHQVVSPQCINRDIREELMKEKDNNIGVKVTCEDFEKMLDEELANAGLTDEGKINTIKDFVMKKYGMKKEEKNQNKVGKKGKKDSDEKSAETDDNKKEMKDVGNLLVFLSANEIKLIIEKFKENDWKEVKDSVINEAVSHSMSRDVALFGRMIASDKNLNVRGALSRSFLVGVTPMRSTEDFYSAIADNPIKEGAVNMGNKEINSSVFYGYSVIDVDQLRTNIQNDDEFKKMISWGYLGILAERFGKGHQHDCYCNARPFYIAIVITDGNPTEISQSILTGKKTIKEIADTIHNELTNRRDNPNRSENQNGHQMKFAEEQFEKGDNFNDFIKENI